jgi:hypothetical protein
MTCAIIDGYCMNSLMLNVRRVVVPRMVGLRKIELTHAWNLVLSWLSKNSCGPSTGQHVFFM